MGITNGFSSSAGFIVPIVTANIVGQDPTNPDLWKIVFFSGTLCYILALIFFYIFGRAEPEPFNQMQPNLSNRVYPHENVEREAEEEPFLSES